MSVIFTFASTMVSPSSLTKVWVQIGLKFREPPQFRGGPRAPNPVVTTTQTLAGSPISMNSGSFSHCVGWQVRHFTIILLATLTS
ncbi:hypothetical protein EDB84DRAFT_262233 [Lactarius hengduanensis]|nr:hypothetical protein EDB84DRAFT_262233 [Lactarius hengduanensis]